ncbi:hypothetical protein C1637_13805 [Chryseobacterium lactis]|uniref:Lipoprotein n=1 Tax=Chryseobacterium lactis TaxID=1241981 RepID=A0A3G6RQP4_CHRLC|nr:hypothetical protein [Chryseobacterium lactis]AZA83801.1 hypothetical protein EG342_18760 [Chryseobacterium lactis]AZB04186.1 hypothetical protein EG341_09635 [Chryseobacterium lactis]PNW12905.1 hypothetical protein C1637_13805 [Chryseobacterium lactis]
MIKRITAICMISVFVVSCKKEAATSGKQPANDSIAKTEVKEELYKPIDTAYSSKNTTEDYIKSLEYYKSKTEQDIATGSPEQNNKRYEDFAKIREKYIEGLSKLHIGILDKYINYYDSESESYKLPENVKKLSAELKKTGLEFREVGEGMTEIWTIPGYYSSIFKNKVTPDYNAYISQTDKESESNYAADAGLIITWEELGDRLMFWENFMNKYPNSKLIKTVKQNYNNYLYDYLLGMDNTPTFERNYEKGDGKLYDENRAEFSRIIKKYPNSNTAKKAKELIALFDAQMPVDQIEKRINIERNY